MVYNHVMLLKNSVPESFWGESQLSDCVLSKECINYFGLYDKSIVSCEE